MKHFLKKRKITIFLSMSEWKRKGFFVANWKALLVLAYWGKGGESGTQLWGCGSDCRFPWRPITVHWRPESKLLSKRSCVLGFVRVGPTLDREGWKMLAQPQLSDYGSNFLRDSVSTGKLWVKANLDRKLKNRDITFQSQSYAFFQ